MVGFLDVGRGPTSNLAGVSLVGGIAWMVIVTARQGTGDGGGGVVPTTNEETSWV